MNLDNNRATLIGEISSPFIFDHEAYGEKFYMVQLSIKRLSGQTDRIPVMVSQWLFNAEDTCSGVLVRADGQFHSFNQYIDGKSHLKLFVFAHDFQIVDCSLDPESNNDIYLDGYICKRPFYRRTPLGREITDVLLAVNRSFSKTDYIPCIAWGRSAKFASELSVGDRIRIHGRAQSRKYQKKIGSDIYETKVAYEISTSKIEVAREIV